jgi:hypothetical protein
MILTVPFANALFQPPTRKTSMDVGITLPKGRKSKRAMMSSQLGTTIGM